VNAERRALVLVVVGALALRVVLLLARGDYIVYDEGYYLLLARSLRAGTGFTLNGLPHVALSPLQPVLVALASAAGAPDLWASRVLAALCGALLVFPVAALARLAGGERAVLPAAVLAAVSPALMSFVPFFPGRSWNLYFGSEPLFLLLAFGAVACAVRAESGSWRWSLAGGALAALAYLTRLEGAVLAGVLLVVLAARLALRRGSAAAWGRLALAAAAGVLVAAPYLVYLHRELGRWALSGRVQAATGPSGGESPSAVEGARSGGQILSGFVWQGESDAFLRALNGLDASGTRMASQYWGVRHAGATAAAAHVAGSRQPADSAGAPGASMHRTALRVWWEGIGAVVPWWLLAIALVGLAMGLTQALPWVFPLAVCALLPSMLTYVEPRSLLPLAPLAAIYAGVALARLGARAPTRMAGAATALLPGVVALALARPAVRDGVQAWNQMTPLQQVASARRAVGEYVAGHLPADATVMSWHPAVAVWAGRPWRVLPYDSFERIMAYARTEGAAAVVFSRFEPSPIPTPPRAFTIVLPGAGTAAAGGGRVQLQPVDETPLLFVGRLAAPDAP
jgi:4-amino-4-deoxy-L-arabinose transferase-like glycosyltransferase